MKEQIRRILGLVASGRLSAEDAAPLLAALHPRLGQVKAHTLERLFGLLDAEDFGPDKVADLLMAMTEPAGSPTPPQPPRPPVTLRVGGEGFPLDGLGDAISSRIDEALSGLTGKMGGSRPARAGTILRIETEDENGGSFSANLPLSLAPHAERLIPPRALESLERSGLSAEGLKLLLSAGPPPGPLLEAEDESGNSVKLSIR